MTETDTDPSNDLDSAAFAVPAIDLFVTKIVDNVSANPGETVTYTVTVGNMGPSTATNVAVSDALPSGLTLVSTSVSQGSYTSPTWSVGTLTNGASATLSVVATVDTGTAGSTITNTAAVAASDEIDTNTSNDTASTNVTVPAVNLIVAKSVSDVSPNPDDTVTYTVQVTNGGPDTATGVALMDSLPTGVSLVSVSSTQGFYTAPVWTIGSLLSGTTVTLSLVATVDTGTEGLTIVNTASVSTVNETDTNPANDSASVSMSVAAVDVSITKTADVPTANPGDTVTFTVTVTNGGPDGATGVEMIDVLPAGLTLVSATPTLGTFAGSTWTLGALSSGASETLIVVATIDAGTAGATITNTAALSNVNETDTDPSNDLDAATVTINAVDVALTKTIDDATPNVGDTVTYTVTATNNGPDTATGVSILEPLPTGVTLVSATPSQGSVTGSTWTVGTLSSGASAVLSIVATVDVGTGGVTTTNTASLDDAIEEDTNSSNDSASVSLTPRSVDLSIDKVVDIANAAPDDTVIFTVTLANSGPDVGTGIVVTDVVPTGLTVVSVTSTAGAWVTPQWTVPSLGAGTSETLVVVATVDAGLWNQTFTNTATVTASAQEDPNPGNDSDSAIVTTALSADLSITKSVDDPAPNAGDTVIYTITVTNAGPDDEPAALVTDVLPPGSTYVSHTASTGGYNNTTGVWTVGPLANGDTETLAIVASVDAGFGATTVTNVATAAGTLVDVEPANNEATADITPRLADVAVTKSAPGSTTTGSALAYELVVSNNGPDTATGVTVTDVLPSGLTYIGSAASVGTYDPGTGVWTVGDLSNGATAALTINVSVDIGASGNLVNTATVSVLGPEDANPGNDLSTVTTSLFVPPVANDDVAATPFETPVVVPVLGNDTDADGTIDPTSVVVTVDPANGTVTVDPVTGALTYSPDAEFSGADIFEYLVCDDDGLCDTAAVFVTIDPENDAPFPFIRDGDGDPLPVGLITYTIAVGETPDPLPLIDPNDDNIISLIITDGELPPGLSINPDGSFSGAATTIGTYTVQIEICDDGTPQRCSLFSVTIRVGETLPYTGLEVVGFIRLGLMFILGGAILLVLAWKRDDEESRDGNAPMVS
ncbi:large cysteine-rich periplasmic protein OmcB, serovar C precursor [bacterium BMS3Bbin02]|nr:large cysteine-rich periplasmic protein OmcB, serovar C precursor [bacterium BMS3Bbin02]